MAADLDTLITSEIPDGRQNLLDSFTNLEKVAEYCENNYFQCENKRAALEETKGYTTQSLASVAYQINTLAYNFLQMLDLQSSQLGEMESQVNHIVQTVAIHKEKVARREIGILTTNKSISRQYKIIAPANPERPMKYVRKPIDYSVLDDIGHGVRVNPQQQLPHHHVHYSQQSGTLPSGGMSNQQVTPRQKRPSTAGSSSGQYGPGMVGSSQYAPGMGNATYGSIGNMSSGPGAGPAPTTKPPTPPQAARYSSGTLSRGSKDYRTPPVVAPPQVPSNYAPNYPRGDPHSVMSGGGTLQRQHSSSSTTGKQYGNLPNPQAQIQMVHPQMQHHQGQEQMMDQMRGGSSGGATMPRLSSGSLRSTGSHASGGGEGLYQQYGSHGGIYGRQQQQSNTLGRPSSIQQQQQQFLPRQNTPPGSIGSRQSNTPPSAINNPQQHAVGQQGMMTRPSQRPPSPPLPPPPMGGMPQNSQGQGYEGQQQSAYMQQMYSRQSSELSANPSFSSEKSDGHSIYGRQMSAASIASEAANAASSISMYARQQHQQNQQIASLMRQSSQGSNGSGGKSVAFAPNPTTTPDLPVGVPKNFIEKVAAIYDYSADKDDELSFTEGATIYVLKKNDDGWWEGVMNGVTGLFPGNYVEASL